MKRTFSFDPRRSFTRTLVLTLALGNAKWFAGGGHLLSQVALCSTQWIGDHVAKPVRHEPDNW
jgi:hypothetical protein